MLYRRTRRQSVLLLSWLLPLQCGVASAASIAAFSAPGPAFAALVALIVVGVSGWPWLRSATVRPAPAASSAAAPGRDLSIDFLRGLAMLFVVVDHIDLPSLYHLISHERIGVVSGAELFVVLSGAVLGVIFRRRGSETTWRREAGRLLRRARTLYLVSLLVALSAYLTSQLPGSRSTVLTTWTDRGTGQVYPLYPETENVWRFIADVLLLKSGPWQFNVMGLYVVLLLLAPPVLLLLLRGRVLWVLAASWGLYLLHALHPVKLLPAQFESSFPLLAWQLLFVHGLTLGYHRQEVLNWMRTRAGRALGLVAALVFAALLFYAWNSPWLVEGAFDRRLSLIPGSTFADVYIRFFDRAHLGIGRLVNVAALLVVTSWLLGRFQPFFKQTLGWLLVPLGQATLYVFILHVYLVYLVANLPFLQDRSVRVNTLVHTAALLLVWVMVKRRVLFRWIPR